MLQCSRCRKLLENGRDIKFAREGDWMGKPLCRKCRAEVEEESRNRYRKGRARGNGYSKRNQLITSVYRSKMYEVNNEEGNSS